MKKYLLISALAVAALGLSACEAPPDPSHVTVTVTTVTVTPTKQVDFTTSYRNWLAGTENPPGSQPVGQNPLDVMAGR